MPHTLHLVDVFATGACSGNPLAVVTGEALSKAHMQAFARWMNFSETTFLLPPKHRRADYRVRIFTPAGELPFAGHPTLGSAAAWLAAGGVPKQEDEIIQECGVGLVRIRREGERLAFAAPPLRAEDVDVSLRWELQHALGLKDSQIQAWKLLDNGTPWVGILLKSAKQLLQLEPDQGALKHLPKTGLIAPQPKGSATHFEVRAFAASVGVPEDPVTGSLNASLAQWLMQESLAPEHYTVTQGTRLGRSGKVILTRSQDQVWVGGQAVIRSMGQIQI